MNETAVGTGNFRALLRYRVDAGDEVLQQHLASSASNNLLTSPQIQNELIECCGNVIKQSLVSDVHKAVQFALIADETTDVSTKEQLALDVRYLNVDKEEICEKFIGIAIVQQTTGEAIANAITEMLEKLNLDIVNVRGQGYDGGANMSGAYRGVQSIICRNHSLALYTHCASHRLNLALRKACSIQSIRNIMGTIENVSSFISRSAHRLLILEKNIAAQILEDSRRKRLKSLCQTRWVERHDSVIVFHDLLPAIQATLSEIHSTSSDSKGARCAVILVPRRALDF